MADPVSSLQRLPTLLGLAPSAVLAVLFWRVPRSRTLSAADALQDGLFFALSVILLAGIIGSLVPTLWRAALLRLGGAVAGVLLGLMVLVGGLAAPAPRAWVLLLAGAAVVFAAVTAIRTRDALPGKLLPTGREKVLAAALALVVPGLQAWHEHSFTDTIRQVSISVSPSLETQGRDEATGAPKVRLSVNVENRGQTRALLLVSLASYCWIEDSADAPDNLTLMKGQPDCGWSRPVSQASWIDAGMSLSNSLALVAPAGKSRLVAGVRIAYARGDRLRTEPVTDGPLEAADHGECVDASYWPIVAESRLKSLIRGTTYLMYADQNNDGGLNYWLATDTTCRSEAETPDQADYIGHYAITETSTWFQAWAGQQSADAKK